MTITAFTRFGSVYFNDPCSTYGSELRVSVISELTLVVTVPNLVRLHLFYFPLSVLETDTP